MGKVARGGGSGQGRSPGLAGGGKGKGKARVDQVVKALSGKTVDGKQAKKKKRAPPSGGASGEASGRPRPPPGNAVAGSVTARQLIRPSEHVTDAAGEAGAAQRKAGDAGPQQDPGQGASARGPAPRGQGGSDGGAAGKRKAHEMTSDDVETVRQVGLLMTPSDTESEDDSAPPLSAPPPPGDSGTSTSARLKKRKADRAQADRALAQRMDAAAEESAAERGLLIPTLLAQLISDKAKGKPTLKIGSEFTCKAELMLNVAALNELCHRRFTARNGAKNEGGGGGGIWCRNSPFAYVASCGGNSDCTFLVKVCCVLLLCMCVRSSEATDNSAPLRCPRPLKLVFRFSTVFVCAGQAFLQ